MLTGGGGSGRGGGVGASATRRTKTGHLAEDYVGQEKAITMLMEEMGLTRIEAEMTYSAMNSYFGVSYTSIRAGEPPSAAEKGKLIDRALSKARPYNGAIYRGLHMDNDKFAEYKKDLVKGGTLDMRGISSWTSKLSVAESFAHAKEGSLNSIIFKIKSTNKAVPVQHLSHYGNSEAEVLAPSSVKYIIKQVTSKGKITYVDLAEVG